MPDDIEPQWPKTGVSALKDRMSQLTDSVCSCMMTWISTKRIVSRLCEQVPMTNLLFKILCLSHTTWVWPAEKQVGGRRNLGVYRNLRDPLSPGQESEAAGIRGD